MWLAHHERRIGLGCMHLSTDAPRDDERALAVLCAALDAGITVFDSARAYARDDDDLGHNERLLARALALRPALAPLVRVVTKGGMQRPGGRWLVDGKARSLAADCAASKGALGDVPIDLYLLHAPDPSVPLATSVRALVTLLDKGHVKHIGLCNVNRAQLDEALALAPMISAVQVSLSWFDDRALIGGVVERCLERDIAVIAHTPLGGAKRKNAIARDRALQRVAAKHNASTHAVALAALLDLDASVIAIPGATSVTTARDCASASAIALDDDDRAILQRMPRARAHKPKAPALDPAREVVLLMGLQGAGKTDALSSWLARGYERLNRDERGGTMKKLHAHLDERLASGAGHVVLDNTYVTRALRRDCIEIAWRHGVPVRGLWFDTALADAQVNVVLRMLAKHGRLLAPHELGGEDPASLPPHAQHRMLRMLERPDVDEGYRALDVIPFARRPWPGHKRARMVALDTIADDRNVIRVDALREHLRRDGAAASERANDDAPALLLFYGWRPSIGTLAQELSAAFPTHLVEVAVCTHGAGPAVCWCRPPLPGLVLDFIVRHGIDASGSVVVGRGPAHRAIAAAIGAGFEER